MSTTRPYPGWFITFEGLDGCGKTTQMRLLAERLRALGQEVLENYEPGGTRIGVQVRKILLDAANHELCATAELLLYFACRAQNVEEAILPALAQGRIVLSDRFTDSTLAYQGVGRGLGKEVVLTLDRIACHGLKPDLTLLIDIDLETSLARARARNWEAGRKGAAEETRMDDQAEDFHRKVQAAYLELAEEQADRVVVVDGRADVETVAERVWAVVRRRLRVQGD